MQTGIATKQQALINFIVYLMHWIEYLTPTMVNNP